MSRIHKTAVFGLLAVLVLAAAGCSHDRHDNERFERFSTIENDRISDFLQRTLDRDLVWMEEARCARRAREAVMFERVDRLRSPWLLNEPGPKGRTVAEVRDRLDGTLP